ncbi:unnamed protein product [Didymodactylos carnosus]|uniref:Uncharacterized protein n=1 Tax=Didymodactylos carnosus TaxID=1234261 RepID=A0A8S2CS74_9BILA|nr:unnamed protein product [Didymodactylos carnosus]CAF3572986.1 unnamed protein product [Didymodactylos carnosus]
MVNRDQYYSLITFRPTLIINWTDIIDLYTPDDVNATEFNDYLVQTYVDISLYGINIWNVHDAIINDLSRTNNHVKGYDSRLESHFPKHPHIYHFIELLRDEHLYQHHSVEESDIQIRKRKKLYNNIDSKLKELYEEHIKGTITHAKLAIKCGRAVKTTPIKT